MGIINKRIYTKKELRVTRLFFGFIFLHRTQISLYPSNMKITLIVLKLWTYFMDILYRATFGKLYDITDFGDAIINFINNHCTFIAVMI